MGEMPGLQVRPLAHDVAVRAIILKHVCLFGYAARREGGETATLSVLREACVTARMPYFKCMTTDEALLFHHQNDLLKDGQWQMALGRVEYLQPLLWALGLVDALPAYDVVADLADFLELDALKLPNFLPLATLRPRTEIDRARDTAELWHWRSRSRELMEAGVDLPASPELAKMGIHDRSDLVRWTARQSLADGTLTQAIEEDFPAFGKAYRDLTAEEWGAVGAITHARHYAFNWLCGWAPENDWDRVPTDT